MQFLLGNSEMIVQLRCCPPEEKSWGNGFPQGVLTNDVSMAWCVEHLSWAHRQTSCILNQQLSCWSLLVRIGPTQRLRPTAFSEALEIL